MITAEQFKSMTGFSPGDDDLERANCKDEGKPGHHACGICEECNEPRNLCGHLLWSHFVQISQNLEVLV